MLCWLITLHNDILFLISLWIQKRRCQSYSPLELYSKLNEHMHNSIGKYLHRSWCSKFNKYLSGQHYVIRTDHRPQLGLVTNRNATPKTPSPWMLCWSLMLGG
ncbi:hypothetical protein PR048_001042 [Dryococelus australis]|uniref:Reverse transcriptase RNase H-like domain-containing protein n=1 Tax=Dryococelus australis TaxID=614101 RepID=A0ABQ9IGC3_9NEOP|nr:hypothetical protein PR048_001042 [Dryococelus australis]